jgi:hypothetical protein
MTREEILLQPNEAVRRVLDDYYLLDRAFFETAKIGAEGEAELLLTRSDASPPITQKICDLTMGKVVVHLLHY